MFDPPAGERIGEVWYTGTGQEPLLAKYIFTSEPLSIQVHPTDAQARQRGLASGKNECWYIVDAAPGALLGLGLTRPSDEQELRARALDGSIEQLVHWQPVRAGDFVSVPAGTIHAIGAGISLLEFQQNADVTFRLYDYGRPRELHLDDAVTVASMQVFDQSLIAHVEEGEHALLVGDGPFKLACGTSDMFEDRLRWILPLTGQVTADGDEARAGDIMLAADRRPVDFENAWALIGVSA